MKLISQLSGFYHEGIWKPKFKVTGMVLAVGQLNCINGGLISSISEDQPWPVSPNPCRKIMLAVALPFLDVHENIKRSVMSIFWQFSSLIWQKHQIEKKSA